MRCINGYHSHPLTTRLTINLRLLITHGRSHISPEMVRQMTYLFNRVVL